LVEAYVLLKIARKREMCGFARSVVEKIRNMKEVREADLLFGEYDAIVHLSVNKIGKKKPLFSRLKKVKGVTGVRLVIGTFDIVVKIEGETVAELEKTYFNTIDKIPGVAYSRLYLVACPRTRK